MWTFFVLCLFLFLFRGKIARAAREKGRSPLPYVLMLLSLPILAAVGGSRAGKVLANFLNEGDTQLLDTLVYGLAITGFIIAIWFPFRLASRVSAPPRTTNGPQE